MKWTLALAGLCVACSAAPVVQQAQNRARSTAAPVPTPTLTPAPSPPCIDKPGEYDTCLTGKRGTPQAPCFDVTAYLIDGVKRREVHAEPDSGSRMLGHILGPSPGDEGRPAPFEVLASRDGWLLIDGAYDDPEINGGVDRDMYHGKGWIRGEGVGVGAQADQGFARPDFASEVVVQGGWFDGEMTSVAMLGCDGSWVRGQWKLPPSDPEKKVHYRPQAVVSRDPVVIEGWVTGVCPIMETTCDGLNGNRPQQ